MPTPDGVQVTTSSRGDATVLAVVGVLDAASLTDVSTALADAQRGSDRVIVDLSEVTFMDSRGLGALLAANERSREGAAPISIHNPSEPVRRLLDVSGVRRILDEVEVLPD